jgi:outer membrane murein-binding lipoprotein Lpp
MLQTLRCKSLLIILLSTPLLLGGCVHSTQDQISSEVETLNERVNALSEKVDRLYDAQNARGVRPAQKRSAPPPIVVENEAHGMSSSSPIVP